MGIEYYAFAFFVFVLICLIALLCKYLFSSVKQARLILEEKETKLLRLYQTVEDAMDEFYDLVVDSKSDIQEEYKKISALAANIVKVADLPEQNAVRADSVEMRTVRDIITTPSKASVPISEFKKALDEANDAYRETPASLGAPPSRVDTILELYKNGTDRTAIARDLGITQNEVDLVIEMSKNIEG